MEFVDNDSLQFFMECSSFSELHQKTFDACFLYDDPFAALLPLSPPMSIHSPSPPPSTAAHPIMSSIPLFEPPVIQTMATSVPTVTAAAAAAAAAVIEPQQQKQQSKKSKKPRRRRTHDLPYAPNMLNLNLSTHISSSLSVTKTLSTTSVAPAEQRRQRSQMNKQQMILHQPGSPFSTSAVSVPSSSSTEASCGMTTTTTTTAYRCDFEGCDKTFTRPYNLKSHRRTHTMERPYACHLCPKQFARQHDRNRHTKLHYGIKPYVCDICNKAFARQDALNRHQRPDNPEASCASIGNHRTGSKRARKGYPGQLHK